MALVLAPTRELALQINAVLEEAGSQCGVRCAPQRSPGAWAPQRPSDMARWAAAAAPAAPRISLLLLCTAVSLLACLLATLLRLFALPPLLTLLALPPPPTPPRRSTVCVYGGVPKRDQVQALRKGAAIVVATPGRLEDLMNDGACK